MRRCAETLCVSQQTLVRFWPLYKGRRKHSNVNATHVQPTLHPRFWTGRLCTGFVLALLFFFFLLFISFISLGGVHQAAKNVYGKQMLIFRHIFTFFSGKQDRKNAKKHQKSAENGTSTCLVQIRLFWCFLCCMCTRWPWPIIYCTVSGLVAGMICVKNGTCFVALQCVVRGWTTVVCLRGWAITDFLLFGEGNL